MGKRRYRGTLKKRGNEQINLLEIKNSSKNQVKTGVLSKKYLNINRKSKLTLTNQEFKNDEIDFMKDFHIDGYDYILFFDGNFKNNISSNTFVVYDILKNNIYNQSKVYKCENSYESEFRALENGLKYLHKNQMITTVLIYGDCKSLISNSNEHFKSYLDKFRSHKIVWIKRDFLDFCDRLSRVVYDNYLINLTKPVCFEKRSNLRSSSKNIILNSDKRQFIEKKKIKKIIKKKKSKKKRKNTETDSNLNLSQSLGEDIYVLLINSEKIKENLIKLHPFEKINNFSSTSKTYMFINNHERVQDECSKKIETLEKKPIEKNENFGIVIKQQTDYLEKNIKNQKNTNFYEEHYNLLRKIFK